MTRPAAALSLLCALSACDRSVRRAEDACRSAIMQHLVEPQAATLGNVRVEPAADGWQVSLDVSATRVGRPVFSRPTCRLSPDFRVVSITD